MVLDRIIFIVSLILFFGSVIPIIIWILVSTKKGDKEKSSRSQKQSPPQQHLDPRRELAVGIFRIINRQVAQVMRDALPEASTLNYFELWAGIYSSVLYLLDQYLISKTVLSVLAAHVVSINEKEDFNKVKDYVSQASARDKEFFGIFNLTTEEMLNDPDYTYMYLKLVFVSIDSPSPELFTSYTNALRATDKLLHQFL